MIRIDPVWAMAGFLAAVTIVVFVCWAFYNFTGTAQAPDDQADLEQCPYCTYVFFSKYDDAVRCPRCRSFLTRPGRPEAPVKET